MNGLAVVKFDFAIIPEIEQEHFVKTVLFWYECVNVDCGRAPMFQNNMVNYERNTMETFNDYLYDLQQYEYVKAFLLPIHEPMVFPIDLHDKVLGEHMDSMDQYRIESYDAHELCFLNDMKKVLDHYKMYYSDTYAFNLGWGSGKKETFHNIPIKEVW